MRLSRDVMPLKKNRMGFIPCEGTSSKGFPFKRGEICYKYVHIKTGTMKCILLQSFHLKDERLSHVDCNTRVSIVGCKPYNPSKWWLSSEDGLRSGSLLYCVSLSSLWGNSGMATLCCIYLRSLACLWCIMPSAALIVKWSPSNIIS